MFQRFAQRHKVWSAEKAQNNDCDHKTIAQKKRKQSWNEAVRNVIRCVMWRFVPHPPTRSTSWNSLKTKLKSRDI